MEVNCEFNTLEECENSRISPYGSCKQRSCQKESSLGVTDLTNLRIQAIPPTNLGIRTVKNILAEDVQAEIEESLEDGDIYDSSFNFTDRTLSEETFKLEPNSGYLDIFNEYVSYVVKYFLDFKNNEDLEWHETAVNELLNNKIHIIESLNPDLNLIFNNLTYPTGKKVNPDHLYEGLIELLITGRMDEFDVSYYKNVYEYQKDVEIVNYKTLGFDSDQREKVGLGIIADSLVPADPRFHANNVEARSYDFISNTKVFLTDIESYIPIVVDGSTIPFNARDDGVLIEASDGTDVLVPPGEGYGYYIPITIPTDAGTSQIPLEFETQLSSAFFVPIDALTRAAELMGVDSVMSLAVTSLSGNSEFDTGYTAVSSTSAMYFALDISAMSGSPNLGNRMINNIKASYKLKSNASLIQEHSIEAGTQVTEVYLHYDDPLWSYLSNTEYCELDLVNIDFTSFLNNRAPLNGEIIVRGIVPRALIFVPAKGSAYTNFHSKSKISTIKKDGSNNIIVTRNCELISLLEDTNVKYLSHALTRKYTYNEYGTYGLGLLGTQESNHAGGVFDVDKTFFVYDPSGKYDNLYLNESTYTSSVSSTPPPTTVLTSGVLKTITDNYKYTHLTWWDLFRRLKLFDYGALQIEMTQEVTNAIEDGRLTDGIKVTHVMSEEEVSNTGITNPELDVSGDTIILSEEERKPWLG